MEPPRSQQHHHGHHYNQQMAASGAVVAIECVAGGSKAEEWGPRNSEMVQTGDVVEELKIGGGAHAPATVARAPFKGGRGGVQKLLHAAFKRGDTSIEVSVRRPARADGGDSVEEEEELDGINETAASVAASMQACIVPQGTAGGGVVAGMRKHYVLRSIRDPNYAVGFVDSVESECIALQGSRGSRVVCALSKAQLQDGYVTYPWEKKMREALPIPNSSCFLSMLILPEALDHSASRYNSLEDTLARANAWLQSAMASGVPVVFMNVQTEALLTKISGETASATVNSGSLADLSDLANASLYGFEDYHGVDIGVVKAVRIWYIAAAGELQVEIGLQEGDTRLGFAISRTDEGFIYISSVVDGDNDNRAPAIRSGLRDLYKEARKASKLLVISRISNRKILPWMVSTSGDIRCFDTVSLSQKLSLHRHAMRPILLHILMWDKHSTMLNGIHPSEQSPAPHPLSSFVDLQQISSLDGESHEEPEVVQEWDNTGDISFRFHDDLSLPNNWV